MEVIKRTLYWKEGLFIRFCPKLRKLYTNSITKNDLEMLKILFNNNRYLESYLCSARSELISEELESFFLSWAKRIPQKLLTLIVVGKDSALSENKKFD
ncbi:hypothetical protein C1645_826724 [Glomus cerebriforme]|uniref:Uncharacterized protein n=1 Tax=Glomus cerebriforme TaxID=658196 RepID=A0A397SQA6_9GLOM|nr:hypothetical protein C1645_826724 [Glomus cerebriforme]